MTKKRIHFYNQQEEKLSALITFPDTSKPHNFVLFAHCFTCNKNLTAIKNITRSLTQLGFAVFSFDFTGLGSSEGDFKETNFSSNIDDLVSAAAFMEQEFEAPSIIVGHSLGGAAAVFAGNAIESIKAVATIGAPSAPDHVKHLFIEKVEEIKKEGIADVNIGGRPFKVKSQFLEDIQSKNMNEVLKASRKALLVIHSPQDATVSIENAKEIYQNAHHPKSFISIDKADHLLTKKKDSLYVGNIIAGWAERYIDVLEIETVNTAFQVAGCLGNEGFTTEITAGKHHFTADEPEKVGGDDFGPSPYELLSASLIACTAMTLRMYANRKEWELEKVIVHVNHGKDYSDDMEEKSSGKVDVFERKIELFGNLNEMQKARLIEIADKCPVHKTLEAQAEITTTLIK